MENNILNFNNVDGFPREGSISIDLYNAEKVEMYNPNTGNIMYGFLQNGIKYFNTNMDYKTFVNFGIGCICNIKPPVAKQTLVSITNKATINATTSIVDATCVGGTIVEYKHEVFCKNSLGVITGTANANSTNNTSTQSYLIVVSAGVIDIDYRLLPNNTFSVEIYTTVKDSCGGIDTTNASDNPAIALPIFITGTNPNANISITNATNGNVGMLMVAQGTFGQNPDSNDKIRIKGDMNGTTIDSGLINFGNTASVVALNWASLGLTQFSGLPLDTSNFVWTASGLQIINAVKNALVITNHPTMVGNPLLYKPIPNKNVAYKIDLEFTFLENGITPSNTAINTIQTIKYLEYVSTIVSRDVSAVGSKGSTANVNSNSMPTTIGSVPFTITTDNIIGAGLSAYKSTQVNSEQHVVYFPTNTIATELKMKLDYVLPYSNIPISVVGNDFCGLGASDNSECYNYLFLFNGTTNQNPYNVLWLARDFGSMLGTTSANQSFTLNGLLLPASIGTVLPSNPCTDTAGASFINFNIPVDLLSLPINTLHTLRMDVELSGAQITVGGYTTFNKYATTQFYISER